MTQSGYMQVRDNDSKIPLEIAQANRREDAVNLLRTATAYAGRCNLGASGSQRQQQQQMDCRSGSRKRWNKSYHQSRRNGSSDHHAR